MYILDADAIVECLVALSSSNLVSIVPKSIPLRTGLGVECPGVIIDVSWFLPVDIFLEYLATEEWDVPLRVKWPVQRDTKE